MQHKFDWSLAAVASRPVTHHFADVRVIHHALEAPFPSLLKWPPASASLGASFCKVIKGVFEVPPHPEAQSWIWAQFSPREYQWTQLVYNPIRWRTCWQLLNSYWMLKAIPKRSSLQFTGALSLFKEKTSCLEMPVCQWHLDVYDF